MRRTVLVLLALALTVAGCGDDDAAAASEIRVFAAASLTDAFSEMGAAFEKANPGLTITLNFAGSSALARQITEGAPADVFASADTAIMDTLIAADALAGEPSEFATNTLAIVTPKDNPARITALADLADADVKVALCAEQVPCGRFALEMFAKAGITVTPVTLEENVKGVVTKNELGEVDAGVAYVTDVRAAGDTVGSVEIPKDQNVVAHYPIATLATADNADGAQAWVDYVLSPEGQATLAAHGFGAP